MSQGTNDAADNGTGQVKGREEREGKERHPGPIFIAEES